MSNNNKKPNTRFDALFGAAKPESNSSDSGSGSDTPKVTKKTKSTDPEYYQATFYIHKKCHKCLKSAAADEEREMSDIVEELIEKWLKNRNPKDI